MRIVLVLAGLLLALPVSAQPFAFDDLFAGRAIKQTKETRVFEGGVRFAVAPVHAAAKDAIGDYKTEHPDEGQVLDLLQSMDVDALRSVSYDELRSELLAASSLTPEEKDLVSATMSSAGDSPEADDFMRVVRAFAVVLSDDEDAVSFALAPYALVNLEWLSIELEFPLAGFARSSDTDFTTGNLNLDLRFGHTFGETVPFGLSYGLALYTPTAGERARSLALQNPIGAVRFDYRFLTIAPYVVAGLDLQWVKLQTYAELLDLLGVRGNPERKLQLALRYGVSAMFTVYDVFAVNAELDGSVDLKDAASFEALYFTAGLRGNILGFKLGAAVQIPIALTSDDTYAQSGGVAFASPAAINVMFHVGFAY